MIDVKWAPLIGATVIARRAWDSLPAAQRERDAGSAAREAGGSLRGGIRKMGDDAVVTMQKRRLQVVHVDAATLADWRKEAEARLSETARRTDSCRNCSMKCASCATNTASARAEGAK